MVNIQYTISKYLSSSSKVYTPHATEKKKQGHVEHGMLTVRFVHYNLLLYFF